jgi:hypothetical protein
VRRIAVLAFACALVAAASACSAIATFDGFVGPALADAAPGDDATAASADGAGAPTIDAAGDARDSGSSADAGTADAAELDAAICKPGLTGPSCADACPTGKAGRSCDYSLVYGLDIPVSGGWAAAADVPYSDDHSASTTSFTRVAFRLVLDSDDVWVEMDAFDTHPTSLGVPVDVVFDSDVTGVLVYSFAANQTSVLSPAKGHLQFWSNCYDGDDGGAYDGFDIIEATMPHCYGTMHMNVQGHPVLSFNRWATGGSTAYDLGIGPAPDPQHSDWTFAKNAATFATRRLEVYVK